MVVTTRSGRVVRVPARYEPDEVCVDDYGVGDYDTDDDLSDDPFDDLSDDGSLDASDADFIDDASDWSDDDSMASDEE